MADAKYDAILALLANKVQVIPATDITKQTVASEVNTFITTLQYLVSDVTTESVSRTIYVATTGSDSVGNGASSAPYLTLLKALSTIKKIINPTVIITISVADGTYSESAVWVYGFIGGSIVVASTSGNAANCTINAFNSIENSTRVTIQNMSVNTGVVYHNASIGYVTGCLITAANLSSTGVAAAEGSSVIVDSCTISNHNIAIHASTATVCSRNNAGTGNNQGLQADSAGVLGKDGTQPTGTFPDAVYSGGQIL